MEKKLQKKELTDGLDFVEAIAFLQDEINDRRLSIAEREFIAVVATHPDVLTVVQKMRIRQLYDRLTD